MNRRTFLKWLGTAAAVAVVAPTACLGQVEPEAPALEATGYGDTFVIGDVFTIAGCYAVNPLTAQQTEHLQQFVVTAKVVTRDEVALNCHPTLPIYNLTEARAVGARVRPLLTGRAVPMSVDWRHDDVGWTRNVGAVGHRRNRGPDLRTSPAAENG